MLLLLAIYQDLLYHLFKTTHFHTILLVPISIHNPFQIRFSPLIQIYNRLLQIFILIFLLLRHKQFRLFNQFIPNLKPTLSIYLPLLLILLLLIPYLQPLYIYLLQVLQHTLILLHLFQNLLNLLMV